MQPPTAPLTSARDARSAGIPSESARTFAAGFFELASQLRNRADLRLDPLGSGTDYTVFEHHLGVPSLNLAYFGEDDGGIYHSIYDDFYWYTHFSDTEFVYGRALAQTVGTAVLRMADAEVVDECRIVGSRSQRSHPHIFPLTQLTPVFGGLRLVNLSQLPALPDAQAGLRIVDIARNIIHEAFQRM